MMSFMTCEYGPVAIMFMIMIIRKKRTSAGRIADDRIADDENPTVGPMERHLAGRFTRGSDDHKRADSGADAEILVDDGAFLARVRRVGGMDRGARAGALAHGIRRARVVAVGDENAGCAAALDFR